MAAQNQTQWGHAPWKIADELRGTMNADDFHDDMLSFLCLRCISDNYVTAAKKEVGLYDSALLKLLLLLKNKDSHKPGICTPLGLPICQDYS